MQRHIHLEKYIFLYGCSHSSTTLIRNAQKLLLFMERDPAAKEHLCTFVSSIYRHQSLHFEFHRARYSFIQYSHSLNVNSIYWSCLYFSSKGFSQLTNHNRMMSYHLFMFCFDFAQQFLREFYDIFSIPFDFTKRKFISYKMQISLSASKMSINIFD